MPGVILGRRLAVGGMGELFLAERVVAGVVERCVVKRLLPGAGEAERLFFARELRALRAVVDDGREDTGIVRVLDAGEDWILLEHVDGVDLQTLLDARRKRGRPLPLGAALHVAEGLLRGLATLESLGVVHRDVHPGNVLLGRDGRVKLADLGVVAFTAEAGPTVAGLKGTLAYMAPEQLRAGRADHRSDVYAAGLVVWEMLTGTLARPAGSAGLAELLAARERAPVPPSTLRPEAIALDEVVLAALAPDAEARPQRVAAWLEEVRAVAGAAGLVADAGALAALVEPLVDQAAVRSSSSRTLGRGAEVVSEAPAVAPVVPSAASRPRWPWVIVPALMLAGLGAWLATRPREPSPRPVAAVALAPWSSPSAPVLAPMIEVIDRDVIDEEVIDDEVSDEDAIDQEVMIDTSATPEVVVAPADVEVTHRVRDVVVARAETHRVRVTAIDGDLYLMGDGRRGLASQHAGWPLVDGDSVLIRVTGGSPAFVVRVRASLSGGRVSLNLAALQGRSLDAECGGRSGPLPMVGLRAPLTCRVRQPDGASMAFRVTDTVE